MSSPQAGGGTPRSSGVMVLDETDARRDNSTGRRGGLIGNARRAPPTAGRDRGASVDGLSSEDFLASCGGSGTLPLSVEGPIASGSWSAVLRQPFLVVGRD